MRRNIRERVRALAPFLLFDPDPYIVISKGGRLFWMMDAFTRSDMFPYSRHYRLGDERVNYLRNSVKVVVDAYDGTVRFYVFDGADPMIAAYRGLFPSLFVDAAKMPADLREHVRYPELMLKVQATAFSLYHMQDPEVFYNREDLWSVASEVTLSEDREQVTRPLDPNFVLMRLPGGTDLEFVEILPFTPSNRNNLIGWIAGRSDGAAYGSARVYDFPKTRLVDGPLQVEARIDQNPQLSSQLTLWNQQGSHVRRGQSTRDSDRSGVALREADLPSGRAKSDAAASVGCPGLAGTTWLRRDLHRRDGQPVRGVGGRCPAAGGLGRRAVGRVCRSACRRAIARRTGAGDANADRPGGQRPCWSISD